MNFANYVARTPGEDFSIDISSPYVASADKFEREKDKHAEKLTAISKTPRVDKLLLNLRNIDAQDEVPVQDKVGDAQLKIASITAKGYGILNTFPGTVEGNANLNFMKVNIITANAKAKFPNDKKARGQFINQKLYENNIDPLDSLNYKSPVTYKLMTDVIDQSGGQIAIQLANNMNAIAKTTNEKEKAELQMRNNNLLLSQHKLINTFSGEAGKTLAGVDRSTVFPTQETEEKTTGIIQKPDIPPGYKPIINRRGAVVLPFGGELPLDNLFANYEVNKKGLPKEVIDFVEPFRQFFNEDGIMMEPKRDMFPAGEQGDMLFKRLNTIFRVLTPEDMDLATLGGYGVIDSQNFTFPVPKEKTFIDPSQLKKKDTKDKK
jgi:hypothetical protein